MQNDFIEIQIANPRTRRIWYGHGSSRLVTEDVRNLRPAKVIDEAMAAFEFIDTAAKSESSAPAPKSCRPLKNSIADLSAQLENLDRQRDRLSRLLHEISA
jgi:hypothetical protein